MERERHTSGAETACSDDKLTAFDTQPQLPFGSRELWDKLPTTKVRRPATGAAWAWAYTYTAFSLAFAEEALGLLGADTGATVLDPFVGSGTTLLAAAKRGCRAVGVDISPFSSLLARGRLAIFADDGLVDSLLQPAENGADPATSSPTVLSHEDVRYIEGVIRRCLESTKLSRDHFWDVILGDDAGRYDSEVVAILSLCLGARVSARVEKGSNPVWLRRVADTGHSRVPLDVSARRSARNILKDLSSYRGMRRTGCRVVNRDVTRHQPADKFDICLTSPPYLNRLDYVVAHLPELSVLEHIAPTSGADLKRHMVGTTAVVTKRTSEIPPAWGPTCVRLLQGIFSHESYASRRYYYHTYFDYFEKLFAALENTIASMRPGGKGIIVLQDSFYKDLHVPTPEICAQIVASLGCSVDIVRNESVRSHMGQMSPHQKTHAPDKKLSEALVRFAMS